MLKPNFSHSFSRLSNKSKHSSLADGYCAKEAHLLCEEINLLKEVNDKLWKQLCHEQPSLDKMKSCQNSSSFSDLLSCLYYAQRTKENIMEQRLRIALESRNTAVSELEDMAQTINSSPENSMCINEESLHEEMMKILRGIECTNSPAKLLRYQKLFNTNLYHTKKYVQLYHKLERAHKDRDDALEKVAQLEDELRKLKVSNDMKNLDNVRWEMNLLDLLCQIIQQMDSAPLQNKSTLDVNNCNTRR